MKLAFLIIFFSSGLWARPIVVLGHFDAFGKASFNNSEKVAKAVYERLKDSPDFELRLCPLKTVFDKSFFQMEDCVSTLQEEPKLVLGLGEANCNFKVETIARNFDKTNGPDNDGVERQNVAIVSGGPREIGLLYPLADMYCSLSPADRGNIEVSNHAGTFVCNNLAYQMAHHYEKTVFGFIHVPSYGCKNEDPKIEASINNLVTMIPAAVRAQDVQRLSTRKRELQVLRASSRGDQCRYEFYKRTKGVDEKGFWSFLEKE